MLYVQQRGNDNIQTYQVKTVFLIYLIHQILVTDFHGNVWQLEGRDNNQILGVKGSNFFIWYFLVVARLKYQHLSIPKCAMVEHINVLTGLMHKTLTFYTLTSVCIFFIQFFKHFLRCRQGEFI